MSKSIAIAPEQIAAAILLIRGQRVILDRDIGRLYNVPVKRLNEAVQRNRNRFPRDFMFHLTRVEIAAVNAELPKTSLRSQSVTSSESNLRSQIATSSSAHTELARKVDELEKKYDKNFSVVFDALRALMEPPPEPKKRRIGFHSEEGA